MFWDLIIQLITRPKPSKQIVGSFVLPFFILIKAREDWHILANKYKQYFLGNYKAKLSNFVYKPNSTLCVCVSRSVMSDSLRSHGLQPTSSSVRGILQATILEWIASTLSREEEIASNFSPEKLHNPGIKPWSSASQADSLRFELQGSPFSLYFSQYCLVRNLKTSSRKVFTNKIGL